MDTPKVSELGRTYLENIEAIEAGRNAARADALAVMRAVEAKVRSEWNDCEVKLEGSSVVACWDYEENASDPLKVEIRLTWDGDAGWPRISVNERVDAVWKAILPEEMLEETVLDEAKRKDLLSDPVGTCFKWFEEAVYQSEKFQNTNDGLWLRYIVRQMLKDTIKCISDSGSLSQGGIAQNVKGGNSEGWPCYIEFWGGEKERNRYACWYVLYRPGDADGRDHQLLFLGNLVENTEGLREYSEKYYLLKDLTDYVTDLQNSNDDTLPSGIAERLASEVIELYKKHRRKG